MQLASAIVERRGGMLIHGAIIAREYGLACVTGIPDATLLIHTGDSVTVDGYLGIVTIELKKDYKGDRKAP
jgi:pyruvate,water dikinase